ncbi:MULTISPECIES: ABC transporter ATP-binding protein [Streptomyces]|uniref:ABC transporter n=1 Tax=Streptomyces canarius TaxID=285453 RepID=A0ABQ3D1V2_9ACTN|nr:ABC transporter ATP-binding protein [Streptomyces canarius]GHA54399.1 ABC transporter [Streptomyces canarius]
MNAVEVRSLRREFTVSRSSGEAPRVALGGIDLSIPEGEIHGLLGPNGAGKTTLCKILSTVLVPTSGTAAILGRDVVADVAAVRPLVGCVFGGDRGLYGRLSARHNLSYWAALYGVPGRRIGLRTSEVLERFGLAGHADDRVETFSRGMKQRLHLARGLVHDPRVLLLDEPTTGMDPVAAHEFRRLLGSLRNDGRTILITTHDMAEAEAVCDRVTLIDHGEILHTSTPRQLARLVSGHDRVDARDVPAELADRVRTLAGVSRVRLQGDGSTRIETETGSATADVLRLLVDSGVTTLSTSRPSLEEVYLRLVGDRGMEVSR